MPGWCECILLFMVVFLHVVVALLGVAYATLSFFSPSRARLMAAYGLIGGTIVSGVYLVWLMPSKMFHVCTVGFIYVALTSVLTFAGRARQVKRQKGSANS